MATVRCLGCMAEYEREYGICPHCGYEIGEQADSALHMQPGTILNDRYLIGRVVGYGGFGVTYIGWDEVLLQRVAIKEYLPSEFATRAVGQTQVTVFGGNKAQQFAGGLTKFVEEAKRLAQFQNEPGIVRVFDSFEANSTAYIVMEYLDGETLTSYLKREGKVPVDTAVAMLTPVIRSLEAVHAAGIIHRDIAPDNLIITKDGDVKLIDFGAARYATTSHSRSLTVIIKPGYSPEEQYRSRGDQGPHTDVYALAAVLYRMVTGVTPPDALERRAYFETKKKDILVPPSKNCAIEKNLETAILNAMNVRVEDRTTTAAAFLEELTSGDTVRRRTGKIKAIDRMKWPLWAKILIPACGAAVLALFALLAAGVIRFDSNLVDRFTIGEGMTRVPSVINYSVGVAQSMLEEQELTSVIGGREQSDVVPANMVLRQGIDAGSVVEKGISLALYISEAPAAAPEEGAMPDVMFYQEEEAAELLQQLGAVVNLEYEYSDDVAQGLVFFTSISVGEPLHEGDEVTLTVSSGPDPDAVPVSENTAEVQKVTLNRSALSLFVGDTVSLTATGHVPFSWSSSNSSVVTVKDGTVTAVGKGNATITVSSDGESATCRVTVQDYSVSLSQTSVSLFPGGSLTITASGAPSGTSMEWSSSNDKVATVSKGKITAVSVGSASITAKFTNKGKTYSASCRVKVAESGITLSKYSASLNTGETISLSATTTPSGQSVTWSSSNSKVATVSGGKVTGVGSGTATITASFSYGGKTYSESCSVTVKRVAIRISKDSLSLAIGENGYLSATTTPSGQSVTWSSSNSKVATVTGSGKVTAVAGGYATITVSMTYGGTVYTDTCSVSVEKASLEMSRSTLTLAVGSSEKLRADVSPESVSVSWSSDNSSVATVNSTGRVSAVSEGTATITASMYYGGSTYKDTCKVTVTAAIKPSIELSTGSVSLNIGDTTSLTATTTPSGETVFWSSSDNKIATVGSSGKVTAVSEGTVTITASLYYEDHTYTDTCTVTVLPAAKPNIKLSKNSLTLGDGETTILTATTTPGGQSVSWSSSSGKIATVSANGRVMAVGEGTVTITASMSYNGTTYTDTCVVTVPSSVKAGVELSKNSVSLVLGEVMNLTATTTPSGQSVTWSSSASDVASVSDSGRVTAAGEGTATITATMQYDGKTYTGTCKITVTAPAADPEVELSVGSVSLSVGETKSLTATTTPSGQSVSWSSSDTGVVSVSSSGKIEAVGSGSAVVTASISVDGKTYSDTCRVSVKEAEAAIEPEIKMSQSRLELAVGETVSLSASTTPSGQSVTWKTTNEWVAAVNNGRVTGISGGMVVIRAIMSYGGNTYEDYCDVIVSNLPDG